jgi:hypothetical protein
MMRSVGVVAIAACLALAGSIAAFAQQQTINVRGTITAFDGKALFVKTKTGSDVAIELPENVNVSITKPFGLNDIKPGMMLGVTTVKRADGTIVAIDVRPIPPTAQPGLTPYDLVPGSTMTNATLEAVVAASAGQELTLNYKTGTVKALVAPDASMSQAAPGSRADLKPGETIFAVARKGEGDRLTAVRVQVSKDGVKPTQ